MSGPRHLALVLLLGAGCFSDPPSGSGSGSSGEETSAPSTTTQDPTDADTSSSGADPQSSSDSGDASSTGYGSSSEEGSSGFAEATGPLVGCGDGVVDGDERCDGDDLQGRSCEAFGFTDGSLSCRADCVFEFSGCIPPEGMVFIPPGPFTMGSADHPDEQPTRDVVLGPYFIDVYEVTAAGYQDCMNDEACPAPMSTQNTQFDDQCNVGQAGRESHPANCLGYEAAAAYCSWAQKRLPTEAEWEKAARGTDARRYPWGDAPAPNCNHAITGQGGLGCGEGSTATVGSVPMGVSPYGLQDMSGNVWEWVSDYYAPYDENDLVDPQGPPTSNRRVIRGGGWYQNNTAEFTTTRRFDTNLTLADAFIGFRCVLASPMP